MLLHFYQVENGQVRKVTDFVLPMFSHFSNRIGSALNMFEVELHLQYSSPGSG